MRLWWAAYLALGTALMALSGCGGSGAPAPNPTPQISGLSPSEITAGSQSFTVFVSGTQFLTNSTVQWNGADRPTTYNSASTELIATISAADVQNAGIAQVTVTNPTPGGGTSLAISFTINADKGGAPTITSLSPSSAALNAAAFTLTVNGTNFVSGDYVTWDGGLRDTTYTSSTQLTAQILASDLTANQVASVAVHTSQLGVASPSVSFVVGNAKTSNAKFPQLISVSRSGQVADGQSSSPVISEDGRYVAFYSKAKNLVTGGPTGNIFLRDTCLDEANCDRRTVAVDTGLGGSPPNGSATDQVAVSANGRYVAFASRATNLASGVGGPAYPRAFVRDTCAGAAVPAGCLPQTEIVSMDPKGKVIGGNQPSISAAGRFVAFTAPGVASALIMGRTSLRLPNTLMVRDTCNGAGAACIPRTILASVDGAARIAVDPNVASAISGSGRYVAFASAPSERTPSQIFLRDTCLGVSASKACLPATERVSVSPDGQLGDRASRSPAISADGRFVVFQSAASNLLGGSSAGQQIYLRDTCIGPTAPFGCMPSTTRISGSSPFGANVAGSYMPAISASGRYVSYIVQTRDNASSGPLDAGYLVVYDTCYGAVGACSPHAAELMATDRSGSESPLTGEIRVRVPVTKDGRLAAFFTRQSVPALRASGFGDVFLTTTPFPTRP